MDEANRCDRVALIQRGRLLAIDTPAGIAASFDRPLLAVRADDRYRRCSALRAIRSTPHLCIRSARCSITPTRGRTSRPTASPPRSRRSCAATGLQTPRSQPIAADDRGHASWRAWARRRSRRDRRRAATLAIDAQDLTRTFGAFTAVDHITFDVARRRGLRFSRRQRRRQDHRDPDAHRPARVRAADGARRRPRRLHRERSDQARASAT